MEAQALDQAGRAPQVLPAAWPAPCRGRIAYPPSEEERGSLLETLLIGEVRAYVAYAKLRYPLYYWRTHDGVEVNLLCETGDGFVAVEMKAAKRWDRRYNRGLNRIRETSAPTGSPVTASHEGERPALWGGVQVLPAPEFCNSSGTGKWCADQTMPGAPTKRPRSLKAPGRKEPNSGGSAAERLGALCRVLVVVDGRHLDEPLLHVADVGRVSAEATRELHQIGADQVLRLQLL